jgi:hypothetical protein
MPHPPDEVSQRIVHLALGLRLCLQLFLKELQQRVLFNRRVKVEDQAVLVVRHRSKAEELGRYTLLEIQNHPNDSGLKLTDPNAGDKGVVGLHLGHQLAQLG